MLSVFVASFRKLIKVLILNLGLYSYFEPNSNTVYEKSLYYSAVKKDDSIYRHCPAF